MVVVGLWYSVINLGISLLHWTFYQLKILFPQNSIFCQCWLSRYLDCRFHHILLCCCMELIGLVVNEGNFVGLKLILGHFFLLFNLFGVVKILFAAYICQG